MAQDSPERKLASFRLRLPKITKISWRDLFASLLPVALISGVAIAIAIHYVQPAPPSKLTITSGPEGSLYHSVAEKYQKILARDGVQLEILPSEGSLQNLQRIVDPESPADIGLVQGGVTAGVDIGEVVSLGSMLYEPLAIAYRAKQPIQRLSELKGKRLAIGIEGSGTRVLALAMLKANGIEPGGETVLLDLGGQKAVDALLSNQADAAFLMGDSASPAMMRKVLHTEGIRLFDFPQAEAYLRRFRYLSKIEIPPGAFDLGNNLPPKPMVMLAPTVELVARPDLHPALSDLLIEAAQEVHGKATLLQNQHEFPAPLEHEIQISEDANRYYKSGKGFAYRHLPFWLASLANRVAVILVPLVVILIPGLRLVPILYGWRIRRRLYQRYAELMALERAALSPLTPEDRAELLARLNDIEKSIITGKIPGAFADESYILRRHINFVRERLRDGKVEEASELPPMEESI